MVILYCCKCEKQTPHNNSGMCISCLKELEREEYEEWKKLTIEEKLEWLYKEIKKESIRDMRF